MADRNEIVAFLDQYLEVGKFQDYAPIGLQVEGRKTVRRIATGVSACVDLFRMAAQWEADMVLVHHGVFWDKDDRVLRGHTRERVRLLLEHDMTLVAYHLPLDAHPEVGNNVLFARAVGLRDIRPFGDYHGTLIGWAGAIDPIPVGALVEKAKAFYGSVPTVIEEGRGDVTSVGVVSGGAWDMILQAVKEGLDCFVTGTADEPVYHLAREEGIHFLAFGHYATERVGVRRLGEVLAERFDAEVRFFDVANPL